MKKTLTCLLVVLLCGALLLCGCKKKQTKFQFQLELGNTYLENGRYEEAIDAFDGAIDIDSTKPEPYAGRAESYMAIGNEDAAREDAKWVIRHFPDFPWAPYPHVEPIIEKIRFEDIKPEDVQPTTDAPTADPEDGASAKRLSSASTFADDGSMQAYTVLSYNAAGQLIEKFNEEWASFDGVQEHMTGTTAFTYDAQGRLLSTDSSRSHGGTDGEIHTYDAAGRRSSTEVYYNGELSERIAYEYSSDGQLMSATETSVYDGHVCISRYAYNESGLLISETKEADGATETVTYEYDGQGRLLRQADASKSIDYDYSQKPFVIQTTVYPETGMLYFQWQYMEQVIFDFYPNDVHCELDADGYVTEIYSNDPESTSPLAQVRYEKPGDNPTVEEMAETIQALYNAGADPGLGTYVVFPEEVLQTEDGWLFTVRFASTAEYAQANVLVETVFVDWDYQATNEAGEFLINMKDRFQ